MKFVRGAALFEGETFCLHCFVGRRAWANPQQRQIFPWNWSILFKRKQSAVCCLRYSPFAVVFQFLTNSYLRGKSRSPFRQEPCRTSQNYLNLIHISLHISITHGIRNCRDNIGILSGLQGCLWVARGFCVSSAKQRKGKRWSTLPVNFLTQKLSANCLHKFCGDSFRISHLKLFSSIVLEWWY